MQPEAFVPVWPTQAGALYNAHFLTLAHPIKSANDHSQYHAVTAYLPCENNTGTGCRAVPMIISTNLGHRPVTTIRIVPKSWPNPAAIARIKAALAKPILGRKAVA